MIRLPNATLNQQIRRFFYAVTPSESSFEKVQHVPDYLNEAIPLFMIAVIVEYLVSIAKGQPALRFNDGFSSITAGLMSQLSKIMIIISELALYIHVYENYRIASLPWDSPWTWFFSFVVVDFTYYWFHRATHELNILWGAHQVHHSSEDYNLSTALRQSVVQNFTSWIFYAPMALVAPPSAYLVHIQFNTLYQFWIHTEIVDKLPAPLEFILNTPSHHRVHHGRNPYCIDKNYGGTLIIWDRIFGTFQPEKEEKVVYGLVHPLNNWNPFYIQICHYQYLLDTFWQMEGLRNKLSVLFKGPGWVPGSPRLGYHEDLPEINYPVEKYDRKVSFVTSIYITLHVILLILTFQELAFQKEALSYGHKWAHGCFLVMSLSSLGSIFEHKSYAPHLEITRSVIFIAIDMFSSIVNFDLQVIPENSFLVLRSIFISSILFWILMIIFQNKENKENKKQK